MSAFHLRKAPLIAFNGVQRVLCNSYRSTSTVAGKVTSSGYVIPTEPLSERMKSWTMVKTEDKSIVQLNPILRPMGKTGSRVSRSLRAEGVIPGVLYGTDHQGNVMKLVIGLDKKILMKEMRLRHMSFENTLYEMNVNGTKYMVTPRQLQVNPLNDEPLGCNFLHYKPGNKLRIPVEFMNTDLNVCIRRGSYIVKINRYLECVCSGLDIPKTIQIDAKDLQDDSLIRLKDVILPPGVSPAKGVPHDYVLGKLTAPK